MKLLFILCLLFIQLSFFKAFNDRDLQDVFSPQRWELYKLYVQITTQEANAIAAFHTLYNSGQWTLVKIILKDEIRYWSPTSVPPAQLRIIEQVYHKIILRECPNAL